MVEGVLVRSRLKLVEPDANRDILASAGLPTLFVTVGCNEADLFTVSVEFVGFQDSHLVRYGLRGYGGSGTAAGSSDYILAALKKAVEDAVTDYLKANFDL